MGLLMKPQALESLREILKAKRDAETIIARVLDRLGEAKGHSEKAPNRTLVLELNRILQHRLRSDFKKGGAL
jgi:hypothetical protein